MEGPFKTIPDPIHKRRCKSRTLASLEPQILAQRMRDNQDIRKKDGAVEAKPVDRLDRHFGRSLVIVDQFQEAALLRAQFAVFRQVASCLAHQPDRAPCGPLTDKRFEETTGHRRVQSNNKYIY